MVAPPGLPWKVYAFSCFTLPLRLQQLFFDFQVYLYRHRDIGFDGDGPDKSTKFSGDGRYDDRLDFALGPKVSVART